MTLSDTICSTTEKKLAHQRDNYREELSKLIYLRIRLKTSDDFDKAASNLQSVTTTYHHNNVH